MKRGLPLLCLLLLGCDAPVAAGLDETEANRIVVVLDQSDVSSTKEPDPTTEAKWRVVVSSGDVPRALSALQAEQLPRAKPPGVLDALGKGSLVPSETTEHAQLVAGLGGDLQRTLEGVEGVLSARVHLNVPPRELLKTEKRAPASASVLVEYRGATPPITTEAIQGLVAGGVPDLAAKDVVVSMVSRPTPAAGRSRSGTHVGPLPVTAGVVRAMGFAIVALVIGIIVLGVLLAMRRAKSDRAVANS